MLIFHHDDLDGRAAAAIALKANLKARTPIAVDYDVPFPIDQIEEDEVVMLLDYTPGNPELFADIIKKASEVIWIDHHGANIKKYPSLDKELRGIRVQSEPSGALLTWQFCYPETPAPLAVKLVSDHDTWLHKMRGSEAFFWGLSYLTDNAPTDSIWQNLLHEQGDIGSALGEQTDIDLIDRIIAKGEIIMRFRKSLTFEHLSRFGYETEFEGHKTIACCTSEKGSGFFWAVIDKYDLVLSYCHNGEKFLCGLYSTNKNVDCAKIAQIYGGGGHRGASGFSVEKLPFKMGKSLRDVI